MWAGRAHRWQHTLTFVVQGDCFIAQSRSSSVYSWRRNVVRYWGSRCMAPGHMFHILRMPLSWFSFRHDNLADASISQLCKLVIIQEAICISLNWSKFNHKTRFYVVQITLRSSSTALTGLTGLRLSNTCSSSFSQSRSGTIGLVAPRLAS